MLELNHPLVVMTESPHPGILPPIRFTLSISWDNTVLGSMKGAVRGDALIFRFYEAHGQKTDGIGIECFGISLTADFAPGGSRPSSLPWTVPVT